MKGARCGIGDRFVKKWVIGAVVLLMALAATWYVASPGYAMSKLRDAAVAGDREALAERVDFPAVRESIKSQLSAVMMAEMAKQKQDDNPLAALGGMFAMGLVNTMIDGMVTPDGIKAMVERGKFQKPGQHVASAPNAEVEWTVERKGLDKFEARQENASNDPALVFKRDGFGWKLTDIRMPADAVGKTS